MTKSRVIVGVVVLLIGMAGLWGRAMADTGDVASAEAQLRQTSDEILQLFKDRNLFKPSHTDQLIERLRASLDKRFDWNAMAKWVLGRHRSMFNAEQTKAFTEIFSQYVVLYYLTQVEQHIIVDDPDAVDDIKIEFRKGRKRRDGAVALDMAFITPKGNEIQTSYTLVHHAGEDTWKVRNFIVEGVSLVRNWRSELAPVRSRETIMSLLEDKVKELRNKRMETKKEGEEK